MIKDTNLTINVEDLDKSISFYESLGLSLKYRWDDHYALIEAPGIQIGLHPTSHRNLVKNSGNVSVGFTSHDFEATRLELKKLGIEFSERKEDGGEFLHFSDPNGTALYFIKPNW